MSKKMHDIYRKKGEKISTYDMRINNMLPVHAGYAYFDANIYDSRRNMLGSYIVWNGIINNAMLNPLTEQGYILECQEDTALDICRLGKALPVYIKLYSYKGKVQTKRVFLVFSDVEYEMAYTGMSVNAPEEIFFKDVISQEYYLEPQTANNGSAFLDSSFFNFGSYNVGSFNKINFVGSYSLGSFNLNSFNISSFNMSSFDTFWNSTSFNVTSFNIFGASSSFNISSFNVFWINSSFNVLWTNTSFNVSSFNSRWSLLGSYFNTSSNLSINNDGFRLNGSALDLWNCELADTFNSYNSEISKYELSSDEIEDYLFKQFYEVYGIGCLGYGLNLI